MLDKTKPQLSDADRDMLALYRDQAEATQRYYAQQWGKRSGIASHKAIGGYDRLGNYDPYLNHGSADDTEGNGL
jgi:hypothetical protein